MNNENKIKGFEDLEIFQEARNLCKDVYSLTNNEPWKSGYRFVQQIRAAAGSVMDNIAEGYERNGDKEYVQFLFIAKGSCGEVRSQIIRASDVGFISNEDATRMYNSCKSLSGRIMKFIKGIQKSEYKGSKYIVSEDE